MKAFVALLVAFLATIALSAELYPGGTWFDPSSPGFSFWGNFWCDLLHESAFNRRPNQSGMWIARVAFWLFAAALFRFWPLAAGLAEQRPVQRWVMALGSAGALLLLLVTVFSSLTDPLLHGVFVVTSALLGALAAALLSLALFRHANWLTRAIATSLLLSLSVSLGQYVGQGLGAQPVEWLAGAQKITTVALFAFMLRCSWLLRQRQRSA